MFSCNLNLTWCKTPLYLTRKNKNGNLRKESKGAKSRKMNEFIKKLSEQYKHDHIVLVCDNAWWHKSKYTKIPKNVSIEVIYTDFRINSLLRLSPTKVA
jgi:hypothetical protein